MLGKDGGFIWAKSEESLLRVSEGGSNGAPHGARPGTGAGAPDPAPLRWIKNPEWGSGMFSSVRFGLTAALAREPHATHVAVSPADLPFLGESSLRTLLEALTQPEARGPRTLVVPVCGRRRGHPLVVPRALAERVLTWPPDARLNRLFAEPDVAVHHVEGFDDSVLSDVDRPADLVAARAERT